MALLHVDPEYIDRLIVKVRAVMAREVTEISDPGGNASDDANPSALGELRGDLSREELVEEIQGLTDQQQAELVALMWIGREDGVPAEWQEYIDRAMESKTTPTEHYLLDQPLLAEYWSDGLENLASALEDD